jgi:biopolymer transport protein ExbD
MSGGKDGSSGGNPAENNPVDMNVVPMVDIIFCLCVFFMCSFQFKELEGRFEAWLPKDKGDGPAAREKPREMRVALLWDEQNARTVKQFGLRVVRDEAELEALLSGEHADHVTLGRPETPLIVDGDARVPWDQVMGLVNLSKRIGIARFELARGPAPSK